MNMKRFVGRNAREAMAQARAAFGDSAVVLSNRPVPGGVEILAMPGADVPEEQPQEPMSTVSFQQFVRERQQREIAATAQPEVTPQPRVAARPRTPPQEPGRFAAEALQRELEAQEAETAQAGGADVLAEIKALRNTLTSQLAGMNWYDTVRRSAAQTQMLRLMIGNGFSPSLARQFMQRMDASLDAARAERWLIDSIARNVRCAEAESIQQRGGVFAVVGPTGVGKTTTTAKIAANFAREHGAASVGLITVDTYRMAASDQLRAFGRLLNIPVHTARDAASLTDLLDLFVNKKLVLIDTVGVGQRDRRIAELFAAIPAARVQRLVVLNAAAQAETLDEVVQAYGTGAGTRCAVTKLDEAVKCGGVMDVVVRRRLVVEGMANGQRVPEDWHAARPALLAQKALLKPQASAWLPDDSEMGLLLTAPGGAELMGVGNVAMTETPHA